MPEVGEKVKRNVKDRVDSITALVTGEIDVLQTSVDHLKRLEPAKAVSNIPVGTMNNLKVFTDAQGDITKRWVG